MNYKIAQLEIRSIKKNLNISDIFISQPTFKEEDLAGKLFILIEIDSSEKYAKKVVDFLKEEINKNYYLSEKILLREKITSLKVEHIFETSLTKTNKNLKEFLKNEKLENLLKKINISAGIIHEDMLHFSSSGNNKIVLVHKTKNDNEEKFNLSVLSSDNANDDKDNDKLFSNVISGKIPIGGAFLFSNESLTEYISNKQLIDILSALPPVSAAEHLKNILSKINSFISFSAIIIKSQQSTQFDFSKIKERAPANSNNNNKILVNTEKETENILSPGNIFNIKGLFKPKKSGKIQSNLFIKDNIIVKKNTYAIIKRLNRTFGGIFLLLSSLVITLFKKLFILKQVKKIKITNLSEIFVFKNISKRNKILLSVLAIFALFFFISTISQKNKIDIIKTNEKNIETISQIEQKFNQTDSSMLYSNEKKAKELASELDSLIESLPKNTVEENNRYSDYKSRINKIFNELRRVVDIATSTEITNFKSLNNQASLDSLVFVKSVNKIYAADSGQDSIYVFDLKNNTNTSIVELDDKFHNLSKPTLLKNSNNIYYLNYDNIVEIKTEQDAINILPISLSNAPDKYTAIDSFASRIYLTNSETGQINRYDYNLNGFITPYAWLDNIADLNDVADMSIDGSVYIIKTNGSVLKFLKGKPEEFNLDTVDPKIESPTKIYVNPETNYIYILESSKNRIVVFDKNGKFINQYQGNKQGKLIDFEIDEESRTGYFVQDSSLYSFKLKN